MKRLHALIVALALVAGCASEIAGDQAPHKYGVNNALVGIESKTIYSCTPATGKQIVFGHTHAFTQVFVRGGTGWAKRHSPDETAGTPPTTPIPSANTVVDGWMRIAAGETLQWGAEGAPVSVNEQTLFVDTWCETVADFQIVAH